LTFATSRRHDTNHAQLTDRVSQDRQPTCLPTRPSMRYALRPNTIMAPACLAADVTLADR
jgi:hypothetical protein